MTNSNRTQHQHGGTAPRTLTSVPAAGAPRPGFWQRWAEWEREKGSVEAPSREHAA